MSPLTFRVVVDCGSLCRPKNIRSRTAGCAAKKPARRTAGLGLLAALVVGLAWPLSVFGGITTCVSLNLSNNPAPDGAYAAAISRDGRYVAFSAEGRDLVTNQISGAQNIYLRDLETRTTRLMSLNSSNQPLTNMSFTPAISGNGRYVAMATYGSGATYGMTYYVIRDALSNRLATVPFAVAGRQVNAASPTFSDDGQLFAYVSGYYISESPPYPHGATICLWNMISNRVDRIGPAYGPDSGVSPYDLQCALSGDGRYVAFTMWATNSSSTNKWLSQIYLMDRTTGIPNLVSVATNGTPGRGFSKFPAVSGDGRFIAYLSTASNLTASATSGNQLFRYDRQTGSNQLIHVALGGALPNGPCLDSPPAISADGRYVAFLSAASNLVASDTNGLPDLFLRDTIAGTTTLVNVNTDRLQDEAGVNQYASGLSVSSDARYITFLSNGKNYLPNLGTNHHYAGQVYVRDRSGLDNDPRWRGSLAGNPNTAFDDGDQPQVAVGLPTYKINTATLNLLMQGTLFRMPTLGPTLALRLTYNSAADDLTSGTFGRNWSLNYDSTIQKDSPYGLVRLGSGQMLTFTAKTNLDDPNLKYPAEFQPPPGVNHTLLYYGSYFTFRDKDTRLVYRYDITPNDTNLYRLTSVADRNGNALTLAVNLTNGAISRISDPVAFGVNLDYQSNRCTSITTPGGRRIEFRYDGASNLVQIVDMMGALADYGYDAAHCLTNLSIRPGLSYGPVRRVDFAYNSRGWGAGWYVTNVLTDRIGKVGYELVSTDPPAVRRINAQGKPTVFRSANGMTTSVIDPLSNLREIEYLKNLPAKITDGNGKIVKYEYDARGNVLRTIDARNNISQFTYDARDNLLTCTTPLNKTWSYEYDTHDNLTRTVSPLGNVTRCEHLSNGRLWRVTDARGSVTQFAYDQRGNVTQVTDAANNANNYEYANLDYRCTGITDARGKYKRLYYDNNDRLIRIAYGIAPNVIEVRNEFDTFAQTVAYDELGNAMQVERNPMGFITQRRDPLGNITRYTYDADNRLTNTLNALSRQTVSEYDDAGRLVRSVDARQQHVDREYDAQGNLTLVRDERGMAVRFAYDENNRLIYTQDELSRRVNYTRDDLGRVAELQNGRGAKVQYRYDADGRLTATDYAGVRAVTNAYDPVGNITNTTSVAGALKYTYDARNLVTRIRYPDGLEAGFAWDASGNVASVSYPGGLTVAYTYDDFNRVSLPGSFRNAANLEIRSGGEKPNRVTYMSWGTNWVQFDYDAAARLKRVTRCNGTVTDYSYDANSRPLSIIHRQGLTSFQGFTLGYDALGNVITETATPAWQPSVATSTLNLPVDAANQLATRGLEAVTYDADGNQSTISGNQYAAVWDAENRPTRVTWSGGTNDLVYDGNGIRYQKATGGQTNVFHYDKAGRLLFETDPSGVVQTYYLYARNTLVAMSQPAAGHYFYHFNQVGHAVALTDRQGNVTTHYAYEPYGMVTASGIPVRNPFTYVAAAGVYDDGDGIFYMKNRYYDARAGRFLSKDPLGIEGGLNLFAYAKGNPATYVDPSGQNPAFYYAALGLLALWSAADIFSSGKTANNAWDEGVAENNRQSEKANDFNTKWDKARNAQGGGDMQLQMLQEQSQQQAPDWQRKVDHTSRALTATGNFAKKVAVEALELPEGVVGPGGKLAVEAGKQVLDDMVETPLPPAPASASSRLDDWPTSP